MLFICSKILHYILKIIRCLGYFKIIVDHFGRNVPYNRTFDFKLNHCYLDFMVQ